MLPIRILEGSSPELSASLKRRGAFRDQETERIVAEAILDVRTRGDAALLDSARRYDSPFLDSVLVTEREVAEAKIPLEDQEAIEAAYQRISEFHAKQMSVLTSGLVGGDGWSWQIDPATNLGQRYLPLGSAGLYVPGGRAAYPSSVLMLAGPANAAQVLRLVLTSPARRDGTLDPSVLVALRTAGIAHAFKIGGAAAIAALALGTESIPRVDKIAGPGNRFVNEAKRQLWGQVGLDGYAGPSEVAVIADETANPRFAAADLITQVEHAPDNAGFLICIGRPTLDAILAEVETQLKDAPRADIIRAALKDESLAIVVRDAREAAELVNEIAPEHVTVSVRNADEMAGLIRNAGCVLIGDWTPESVSDYALGPSHTLPTGGSARFASPVNVLDFLKVQSVTGLTEAQLQPLAALAETLGRIEGFPAHSFGATVRYPKRS